MRKICGKLGDWPVICEEVPDQFTSAAFSRGTGARLAEIRHQRQPSAPVHAEPGAARFQIPPRQEPRVVLPPMRGLARPLMKLIPVGGQHQAIPRMMLIRYEYQAHNLYLCLRIQPVCRFQLFAGLGVIPVVHQSARY
ncbi:hypothetical protein MnTg04_00244 [bacterium MnTg04]|nr:hypothetical protein MnTg04_00244 [bacterium MnTg04]